MRSPDGSGGVRRTLGGLMSRGRISAGWYAILTGVAMLLVAYALGSVGHDDRAAWIVAVVLVVVGVWQLERGVRAELARRRSTG